MTGRCTTPGTIGPTDRALPQARRGGT